MYSSDYVQGHVSAIRWFWRQECPKQLPTNDFDDGIKAFMAGLARREAEARSNGELPVTAGKSGISFTAYQFLATISLQATDDFFLSILAHLFLILCWNLMSRSISAANLHLGHLRWSGDSLQVLYSKHKGWRDVI